MLPNFEGVKNLFLTIKNPDVPDHEFDSADERAQEILPKELYDRLSDIEDANGIAFENVFFDFANGKPSKAVKAEPKPGSQEEPAVARVPGGYPELLPWPPNKEGVIEFPDYAIDFRGIPHGLGNRGRGRKKGELSMDRFYKGPTFICRYRLTDLDGERKNLPPHFCARVRTHAEQIHKKTNFAYLN